MKWISKRTGRELDATRDYEYTDWPALEKFACDFVIANRLARDVR